MQIQDAIGASLAIAGLIAAMLMVGQLIGDLPAGALVARIGADAANALHYAHELRDRSGELRDLMVLANTVGGLWTDALVAHFDDYVRSQRADAPVRAGAHPAIGEGHTTTDLAHAFLYQQNCNLPVGPYRTARAAMRRFPLDAKEPQ